MWYSEGDINKKKMLTEMLFLLLIDVTLPQPAPTRPPVPRSWSLSTLNIYPNPQSNPSRCNRDSASWICDPNQILDDEKPEVDAVNNRLTALRMETKGGCPCFNTTRPTCDYSGLPFIVAIMRDFQPENDEESLMKTYAEHFSENVSFFTCLDCVVYVISANSKKVYRHYCDKTRDVTMKSVSDRCEAFVEKISDKEFNSGGILKGLESAIQIYSEILEKKTDCTDSILSPQTVQILSIVLGVVFGALALVAATIVIIIFIKKNKKKKRHTDVAQSPDERDEKMALKENKANV